LSNVVNIKTDIFDSCQFASKPYLWKLKHVKVWNHYLW
jgi:hypothetical protein